MRPQEHYRTHQFEVLRQELDQLSVDIRWGPESLRQKHQKASHQESSFSWTSSKAWKYPLQLKHHVEVSVLKYRGRELDFWQDEQFASSTADKLQGNLHESLDWTDED